MAETLSEGVVLFLCCLLLIVLDGVAWDFLPAMPLLLVLVLLALRRSVGFWEEDTPGAGATGGRRLLVLLLVACRLLAGPPALAPLALRCFFALSFDVWAELAGRDLPVPALVVLVDAPSSSSRSLLVVPSFFTVFLAVPVRADVAAADRLLLLLADGLDDDEGREGMLARIPPPASPDAAAAGEADLRVLMARSGEILNERRLHDDGGKGTKHAGNQLKISAYKFPKANCSLQCAAGGGVVQGLLNIAHVGLLSW